MNNWKEEQEYENSILAVFHWCWDEQLITFIENLLEETYQKWYNLWAIETESEELIDKIKKEERERIINEIENVVNWLFMNYEEKIDIMKERLEEFKTNK